MENIIEIKDVDFHYSGTKVLSHINMQIKRGEIVALLGNNGAGKSTLLKLILGQLAAIEGQIFILGKPIAEFKDWYKIGYVPQGHGHISQHTPATVEEIVGAQLFREIGLFRRLKEKHHQRIIEALSLVEMEDYRKKMIGQLSGGQLQRVLIARALVASPDLLILDEPTTGIDAKHTEQLYELLKQLNKAHKQTILMVTHDMRGASNIIDTAYCLEHGNMLDLPLEQLHYEVAHSHVHHHEQGE